MSQRENNFIAGVHKYLPVSLHREKMHNPYRGGTADVWYSGVADLWIEYKFVVVPARIVTSVEAVCTELQKQWLRDRHTEGRRVYVIVGCKQGGVWFDPFEWEEPMSGSNFRKRLQDRSALAERIFAVSQGTQ